MWVIKINNIDTSCHTQECDAITQKVLFINNGILEEAISIVESSEFNPPQE
jgi:hypothetical protein